MSAAELPDDLLELVVLATPRRLWGIVFGTCRSWNAFAYRNVGRGAAGEGMWRELAWAAFWYIYGTSGVRKPLPPSD